MGLGGAIREPAKRKRRWVGQQKFSSKKHRRKTLETIVFPYLCKLYKY
jgi:hypothetical protein